VAVLSRGYKRKTKGFILADENSNSDLIGDEPFQIYKKFPSTLVAVDANRRRGIRYLLNLPENQKPDVILLDDAFQHRYVKPSLSILLSDVNRPFYDDYLLPAGRLRENPENHKRADYIIYTKCPESYTSDDYRILTDKLNLQPHQQLFFSSYRYKNLLQVFSEVISDMDCFGLCSRNDVEILLVAGLANPSGLIEYVKKYFSDFQTIVYPDHHEFSYKDIQAIVNFINSNVGKNKIIITSEKDAMRLVNNPFVPDEIKAFIYYLPIEVNILFNEELFKQKIENHVGNFKRNSILA
jgi:tetraacyldisaccharide 4'-kinase